jgi:predicted transcriptional regulator
MSTKTLSDVMELAKAWPDTDQEELLEFALEIEARRTAAGVRHATPDELEGIDRGLQDARDGRFATDEEVEAVFTRYRGR